MIIDSIEDIDSAVSGVSTVSKVSTVSTSSTVLIVIDIHKKTHTKKNRSMDKTPKVLRFISGGLACSVPNL